MRRVQALGQNEHTQYCFLPPPLPITAQQPHPGVPITRGTSCPGVPVLPRGVRCRWQLCKSSSGWFSCGSYQLSLLEQQQRSWQCLGSSHGLQGPWQLARRGCSVLSQQVPEAVAALGTLAVAAKCQPGLRWKRARCSHGCCTQRAKCQHKAALQPCLWRPGADLVIPAPRTKACCCFGFTRYLLPNPGAGLCPARAAGVEA